MTIRQRANGTFELRVTHKLLDRPNYSTHDTEAEAATYRDKLRALLNSGTVPIELQAQAQARREVLVRNVIGDYLDNVSVAPSDKPMVEWLLNNLDLRYVSGLTVLWVDQWIKTLKTRDKLAPGTIRKKVECFARVIDWHYRREYDRRQLPSNPLRTLPVGYSTYRPGEGAKKVDKKRDRRLHPGEQEKIEAAQLGWKSPNKQRSIVSPDSPELLLMFRLIVNTGMRLREAYTLRRHHIRFDLMTIHIQKSKTDSARDIPITPQVYNYLQDGLPPRAPAEPIFSAWDGEEDSLEKTTAKLSARFRTWFRYVGINDLTEHDLRHEATCRWMLMKNEKGQWRFRPEEVKRITGHKTQSQFERYLSLRGSEFADRLWEGQERPSAPLP